MNTHILNLRLHKDSMSREPRCAFFCFKIIHHSVCTTHILIYFWPLKYVSCAVIVIGFGQETKRVPGILNSLRNITGATMSSERQKNVTNKAVWRRYLFILQCFLCN